ncbi:MAG: ATP-binding cassette domain-containing protein, partial [Candidatus Omnitrophica bacterium]|nr:ATP-binding cassette domain-containing protein [Candidatus Omnitrophota bacterium]
MAILAKEVRKIYKKGVKEVQALNGVSLEIERGYSLAVVGPSGAGKSTLLHILGALDEPDEGSVILDGKDLYHLSDRERSSVRNRSIGF